jgi:diadenosine tetraphosphatase ApaH/serine/threonine PP2A family protein phosphatase
MRYGILGDIHANLSALEAALDRLELERVDRIISVGDVVGYGAAPRECIRLLQELDAHVVKGNHDAACVGEVDTTYFNQYARFAVQWTIEVLGPEDLRWLRALPMTLHLGDCEVAHGTLDRPENYDYLMGVREAAPSLGVLTSPVCFVGHSHIPITVLRPREAPDRLAYCPDSTVDLSEADRAIVNVGSVGQPRDEDPRLAVAVYDSEQQKVWIHRCAYDIEREALRIRAAGLPGMLADRLWLGV